MTQRPGAEATVAAAVLRALRAAGATTVFGLPGTHNMAFWAVPGGGSVPRLVNVRHEQTAVYAADGWPRIRTPRRRPCHHRSWSGQYARRFRRSGDVRVASSPDCERGAGSCS